MTQPSYRRFKVSHHKTFRSAKAKADRLNREAPDGVTYNLIVSELSPHMPHEVWITDYRKAQ